MVTTRSGASFVGQVTAILPGEQLVLRLYTNEERAVPWADVLYAVPAGRPYNAGPTASPDETAVSALVEGMRPGMRIERILKDSPREGLWDPQCRAPCIPLDLYRGYVYRVVDPDAPGTAEFQLFRDLGSARLRIRGGSFARNRAGIALLIVGALGTTAAAVIFEIGNKYAQQAQQTQDSEIALGLLGLGLPSLAVGSALLVTGLTRADLSPIVALRF
jgi:hypothetical protein